MIVVWRRKALQQRNRERHREEQNDSARRYAAAKPTGQAVQISGVAKTGEVN
jgi:hypothetical protein